MSHKIEPDGLRLPLMNSPEAIDANDSMTDDMKEFAKKSLARVPHTDGWYMLGNNPDMQAILQIWERQMTALFDGDFQGKPFGGYLWFANEIISHEMGNEYNRGVMTACTVGALHDQGFDYNDIVKSQMLDFPDHPVWSEEERLCIKFIRACVRNEMTDELMQAAIDSWGENQVVLRMCWLGYVMTHSMIQNALNMHWDQDKEVFPYGALTPENVKAITDSLVGSHLAVRDFWLGLDTFDEDPMDKV
ncbi:MAG: hypothetical protein LIO56_06045 [Lachnospiraceae bacterium]|nr:hypothetical protein [Lachnospiraceae bacterium]